MGKCPGEYKVDDGAAFGKKGDFEYGWGRDMTGNARNRASQPDELLRSFIMFPPDPSSLQCKKPNPDVVCDPVEWSIKVPRGKYDVKMTVGDAEKKLGYSLTVNG